MKKLTAILPALVFLFTAWSASAAQDEVRIGRGRPFGHLPLIVMQYFKLYENHAAADGIKDFKVIWTVHPTTTVGSDALLSGNIDILSTGAIQGIVLWSKTKGTPLEIKHIAAEAALPTVLVTRNPAIQSIRDLTPKDRIAVVAVKVSNNAILLQMAAAKEFGQQNFARLDPLTVTRAAPDAVAALLSPSSEISVDFNIPPYTQMELENPGIHAILNSADILGDPTTFSLPVTTTKFYERNPLLIKAFFEALQEADEIIAKDKPRTIEAYHALGDNYPDEILKKSLDDPRTKYSVVPTGMLAISQWMQKTGMIDKTPADWKELFFPVARDLNGS